MGSASFRANTTATGGAGTTIVINVPGSVQNGDFLLLSFTETAANPGTLPGGWTALATIVEASGFSHRTAWRIAASEPGSYTVTFGSNQSNPAQMFAYQGANTANPVNASASIANASSPTITGNGVTTTVPDATVLWLATTNGSGAITVPSGFTSRASLTTGSALFFNIADKVFAAAGATGGLNGSIGAAASSGVVTIALAPSLQGAPLFFGGL